MKNDIFLRILIAFLNQLDGIILTGWWNASIQMQVVWFCANLCILVKRSTRLRILTVESRLSVTSKALLSWQIGLHVFILGKNEVHKNFDGATLFLLLKIPKNLFVVKYYFSLRHTTISIYGLAKYSIIKLKQTFKTINLWKWIMKIWLWNSWMSTATMFCHYSWFRC